MNDECLYIQSIVVAALYTLMWVDYVEFLRGVWRWTHRHDLVNFVTGFVSSIKPISPPSHCHFSFLLLSLYCFWKKYFQLIIIPWLLDIYQNDELMHVRKCIRVVCLLMGWLDVSVVGSWYSNDAIWKFNDLKKKFK